jgi:DNA-binding transcriptional MocR family regulator
VKFRYELVISFIEKEIKLGNLKPGSKLPSIRDISKILDISTSTIIRAYKELEKNHIIYSVAKSGYYIVKSKNSLKKEEDKKVINFLSTTPDSEVIPYLEFKHCINQAIDTYKEAMFSYSSSPHGLKTLRKVLAKHLQNQHIFTSYDNIFITTGAQQAIDLLIKMPFPNGNKNVLVEQPTYLGMINSLKLNKVNTIGIKRDINGIDFNELETIFRNGNIKFFYTMPRFQNPTGFSYNDDEKKRIINLAEKYNVYIVEDDYLSELETDTKSDPLYCFDNSSKVIYIKSYSKTMLPGLRVAAVILPKLLSNVFLEYKKYCDKSTSILSQGTLEIFISSGMFQKYKKKIKLLYEDKMNRFKKVYSKLVIEGVNFFIPHTGFFIYVELPETCTAQKLVTALQARNVSVTSCEDMFLQNFKQKNVFRISLSSAALEEIEQGMLVISQEIYELLNTSAEIKTNDFDLGW